MAIIARHRRCVAAGNCTNDKRSAVPTSCTVSRGLRQIPTLANGCQRASAGRAGTNRNQLRLHRPTATISSPLFNDVVMASELGDVLQGDVKVDRAEATHLDGVPGLYAILDKDGRSQSPFAMGILTIKSVRDRLVCITWDVGSEGLHGRTTYVSIDNVVLPPAQPASRVCSKCGGEVGLTARQCRCGHRVVATKLDEDPQRLSLQMYGNLATDANVLKELSEPRSDGLQLTEE